MTEIQYPARLTLEWLKANEQPVYVRNTTRPRGQLTINMPVEGGRIKAARIHRTHLPVELSAQFSMETILRSDDLRQCLVKGVLDLVRPDVAREELSGEDAIEAVESMQLSQYSAKQNFVSERVKDMESAQNRRPSENSPSISELGVETHIINPRILGLVQKLQNKDIGVKAAVSELKIMADELKETDCSYIISNTDGQVKSFAQKQLAKVRAHGVSENSLDDIELTPSEQAEEARREALARQHQHV